MSASIEKVVAALLPGGADGSSADDCKDLGNKMLSAGKLGDAIWLYSLGLKKRPGCHILLSNRSAANAKLGRFDLALSDANECIKCKPDWGKGHGRRGAALEGLGKQEEALKELQLALQLDPTNAAAAAAVQALERKISGEADETSQDANQSEPGKKSDTASAESKSQAAPADDPASQAEKCKQRGNRAFAGGNFEDAIQHFTEAIALDKNNHVLYSNRSGAFASVNQFQSALADAQKCINLAPNWAKGYGRKAAALTGLNRRPQAIDAYRQGLAIEPDNKLLLQGLAELTGGAAKPADPNDSATTAGGEPATAVKTEPGVASDSASAMGSAPPAATASASTARAAPEPPAMDEADLDLLSEFLSETTDMERKQQAERIIKHRLNPFEVLQMQPAAATPDELTAAYRRISLSVHPDKCKHPRAEEAFEICKKALAELQDVEKAKFYVEVMHAARDEAERELRKRKRKERDDLAARKKIRTQDVDKLRAAMLGGLKKSKPKESEESFGAVAADEEEFTHEDEIALTEGTREAAYRILTQLEKRRSRAEKVFIENEKRGKMQLQEAKDKNKFEEKVEEDWSRDRLDRIDSWRDFTKTTKVQGIKKPKPHITEKGVSVLPPTMGGIKSSKEEEELLSGFMDEV